MVGLSRLSFLVAVFSHYVHDPMDEIVHLRAVVLYVIVFHEIAVEVVVELPRDGEIGVQ